MAQVTRASTTYGNLAYAEPMVAPQRQSQPSEYLQPKVREREEVVARPKVSVRERNGVPLFGAVGFSAVAIFAVLLIQSLVQLTVITDSTVRLKGELSSLQVQQAKLLAQYELAFDLSTVEAKVLENGSMVKPQSGQIYTIDLMESDSVVRY